METIICKWKSGLYIPRKIRYYSDNRRGWQTNRQGNRRLHTGTNSCPPPLNFCRGWVAIVIKPCPNSLHLLYWRTWTLVTSLGIFHHTSERCIGCNCRNTVKCVGSLCDFYMYKPTKQNRDLVNTCAGFWTLLMLWKKLVCSLLFLRNYIVNIQCYLGLTTWSNYFEW